MGDDRTGDATRQPGEAGGRRAPSTGETARGTERELRVTASTRVCLQVQLIRDGEPSTSTQKCVE